ncbi:UvrD-helicase domain-containing protein [Streptomyces sp. MAR4 CNX-425]|uniref:UvrD-helicase domain-containing protein n=1 Tax=Streptomyces sp. MAR4 CNX-425 TaxID=3406343 RepID=UPI003B514744
MPARLTHPDQLKELLGIPFTAEQTACITAPPAPQVIVAGAGSGKTTVMAARVVWLVGTGQVAPEQVLGLTFTNKAAAELAERVRRALARAGVTPADGAAGAAYGDGAYGDGDAEPGEPRISTYHAFAGQLLKDHGVRIGLEPGARLLADATRYQLAAHVLRTAPGPFPALTKSLPALVTELLALDAELAEHLVDPDALADFGAAQLADLDRVRLTNDELRKAPRAAQARQELLRLVRDYRREKRRRDLLDFGDQIAHSALLAEAHPAVGRQLRDECRVVLLDEYQDTSVAQRRLLAGLFGGSGGGAGHAVTAVGDPCQAIYGWRGASVANLDDFPVHFPYADGRPARRQALSENRRSGGRLLALANGLAAPLRERHVGVEALRPAAGAERHGTVRCALLPTYGAELAWLADSVAHLVRTGTAPGDIAVLCRTAGDFGEIQAALVARDVPVEVVGLAGLLDLPEVADLVAMCEVLQDPAANAALVRLLTGPRWRIGARDLALLGRRARLLVATAGPDGEPDADERLVRAVDGVDPAEVASLADALDTFLQARQADDGLPFSAAARKRFARLATELRELRRSLADPLMDVLHRVLGATGLEVELSASPHALAARRRETLARFLDVAADYAASAALDGEATLLGFLGFLRTAAQYEKGLDSSLPGDGRDTVKVLTAHKAKGLEWDVVAVPGLVEKHFPSRQPRESWVTQGKVLPHALRGDAETLPDVGEWTARGLKDFKAAMREHQEVEELRLGYVTVTRPRSLLLGSGHWWGPTQKEARGPSAFLDALREHCERGGGEVEAWAPEPPKEAENPALAEHAAERAWPLPLDPAATTRRREAAAAVRAALARRTAGGGTADGPTPGADGNDPPAPDEPAPGVSAPGEPAPGEPAPGVPVAGGPVPGVSAPGGSALGVPAPGDEPPASGGSVPHASAPAPEAPGGGTRPDPALSPAAEHGFAAEGASGPEGARSGAPGESAGRPATDPPPAPEAPGGAGARTGDVPPPGAPVAPAAPPVLGGADARVVESWDRDLDALEAELRAARQPVRDVTLPASLTASQLLRLAADPETFTRELARPMPRPPMPAARRGTRFHAWVESRFEALPLPMLGPDELPGGAADGPDGPDAPDIADERDLAALKEAFERSPYARRTPYRLEAPFELGLAGRLIRGRIDAVYRDPAGRYEIVDWKTGRSGSADPLQLAVYRLAWAEQERLPLDEVTAAFLFVRTGEIVRPPALPGRAELEALLSGRTD